jgi:hypothetical protein
MVLAASVAERPLRGVDSTFLPTLTAAPAAVFPGTGSSTPSPCHRRRPRGATRGRRTHRVDAPSTDVPEPGLSRRRRPETRGMHPLFRAAADRQLGLFTMTDTRRAGYGQSEVRRLVASGHWARLRRGVYVRGEELAEHEARGRRHEIDCLAVLLTLERPTAAVSHSSAARLWQLSVPRQLDTTVRLTDPGSWRRGTGYLLSEAPLRPGDRARLGLIQVTSAARTLVDVAREWPLEDAVVAMDAALMAQRTTKPDVQRAGLRAELGGRSRRRPGGGVGRRTGRVRTRDSPSSAPDRLRPAAVRPPGGDPHGWPTGRRCRHLVRGGRRGHRVRRPGQVHRSLARPWPCALGREAAGGRPSLPRHPRRADRRCRPGAPLAADGAAAAGSAQISWPDTSSIHGRPARARPAAHGGLDGPSSGYGRRPRGATRGRRTHGEVGGDASPGRGGRPGYP